MPDSVPHTFLLNGICPLLQGATKKAKNILSESSGLQKFTRDAAPASNAEDPGAGMDLLLKAPCSYLDG
jgi:hypothetical protein